MILLPIVFCVCVRRTRFRWQRPQQHAPLRFAIFRNMLWKRSNCEQPTASEEEINDSLNVQHEGEISGALLGLGLRSVRIARVAELWKRRRAGKSKRSVSSGFGNHISRFWKSWRQWKSWMLVNFSERNGGALFSLGGGTDTVKD